MRRRGVDLMSGQGGLVSSAHSAEDVAATVEAFHGAAGETRDFCWGLRLTPQAGSA